MKILLVDDHMVVREGVRRLLSDMEGVQIFEAASGEEALALLDEIGILPDRGLVDYRLGSGMDGLELAERLKAAGMAVRLITADRSQSLRGARVGVLAKPIAPEALAGFLRDG